MCDRGLGDPAFDGEGELGEIVVACDPTELSLGLKHPSAVHLRDISPDCQRLTFRELRRMHSIIDSQGFVLCSVRFSALRTPRRVTVSVSSMPLLQGEGSTRVRALELCSERLEFAEGAGVILMSPRAA